MNKLELTQTSVATPIGTVSFWSRQNLVYGLEISNAEVEGSPAEPVLAFEASVAAQIEAYFGGSKGSFQIPVELQGTDFQKRVWAQVANIEHGKTATYGEIAAAIGMPRAARAVGAAVGANPVPLIVGCHRVLGASKRITGYSGGSGIATKAWLLNHEAIEFQA